MSTARRPSRNPLVGYGLYLVATTLFALNGSVMKVLLESGIPPTRLSQLRVTSALVILALVVLVVRRQAFRLRRAEVPGLLVYGILGIALTQVFYVIALSRGLPVGVALLIEFTSPIMLALWLRFGRKEPVRAVVWWALGLALLGLAMVAQLWRGFSLDVLGVASAILSAILLVVYYMSGERVVRAGGAPRDPLSLTMWGFAAAALFWAIVQPWWTFPWTSLGNGAPADALLGAVPQPVLLAYMVVGGTVLPFTIVLASLRHLRAPQAATVGMSEPVIASGFAWVLLGEVLTPVQVLGGLIVLTGVFLAERSR